MIRASIDQKFSTSAKRFAAWLLIAVMLPFSTLSAQAFVWCTGADGHSAIEFCGGAGCHEAEANRIAAHPAIASVAKHQLDPFETGCTDVAMLSAVRSTRDRLLLSAGSAEQPSSGDQAKLIFNASYCPSSIRPVATAAVTTQREFGPPADPNILLRRITVLRI